MVLARSEWPWLLDEHPVDDGPLFHEWPVTLKDATEPSEILGKMQSLRLVMTCSHILLSQHSKGILWHGNAGRQRVRCCRSVDQGQSKRTPPL